jgi:hypothetical protein
MRNRRDRLNLFVAQFDGVMAFHRVEQADAVRRIHANIREIDTGRIIVAGEYPISISACKMCSVTDIILPRPNRERPNGLQPFSCGRTQN